MTGTEKQTTRKSNTTTVKQANNKKHNKTTTMTEEVIQLDTNPQQQQQPTTDDAVDQQPKKEEEKKVFEHAIDVKDCPIRAVKVYDYRAEVTRAVKLNLIAGEQMIVLQKIPKTSMFVVHMNSKEITQFFFRLCVNISLISIFFC